MIFLDMTHTIGCGNKYSKCLPLCIYL